MTPHTLHELVRRNDLAGLNDVFARKSVSGDFDMNPYDRAGYTPLMRLVMDPEENPMMVQLLLDNGADVHTESRAQCGPRTVMALALGGGSPSIVNLLLQRGANIHYCREHNYGALVDAVHGRDVFTDMRLIELLNLLVINRVELSAITSYGESGLRVLSRIGRFDAVGVLLDAGADVGHLRWTPLMHAIALGSLDDVEREVNAGASLGDRDFWERTSWLLSLQTGDLAKASYLFGVGGDLCMRGRCNKPPLLFAVESGNVALIRWLIEIGVPIEETGDSEKTALMAAIEANNLEIVRELIKAGADMHRQSYGQTVLSSIRTREMGRFLLTVGGEPDELGFEGQRSMLGLSPDTNGAEICLSQEDFDRGWSRKFGAQNPERIDEKFYESMIRAGVSASTVASIFERKAGQEDSPIWCAQRFGQSITFLPDGRIIQIAGEHEDFYDKDFCIYNDVFVHHPNGKIDIFGYPEEVFLPTDFHTATLLEEHFIWLIGGLGYAGKRIYGITPIFRLDTKSMKIEEIDATGPNPGWIYGHAARIHSDHEIRISGGKIVSVPKGNEEHHENGRVFIFDIQKTRWRSVE